MRIGAVVPARFGSKRVPHKNVKMLGGKPLLCWTVDKLLEAGTFQNVCVSTESDEVAKVVRRYYPASEVEILKRPAGLAADAVSATDVFMHYLDTHPDIEYGGIFLPTYPFRRVEKLQDIDAKLRSRYYWRATSVSNEQYCTGEFFFPTDQGLKNIFARHVISAPMYTSTYCYHHRSCPPGMWAKYYQSQNERALTVTNDFQEDLDIDSPEDFRAAEQIASGRRARTVPLKEHRVGDWVFTIPEGVDLQSFINFIGPEKLESIEHPIMIAKLIKHEFASSLRLLEVFGRQMFACAEAYAYIVQMNVADPGANSQDMPKQYTASKYYRAHRLPETYSVFTNRRDCAAYDHHGIEFAVENVHTFSNKPVAMPRPGCALAADTLAWDRVIMEEDLKKQAFYVDPIRFEDPEGNGDSFHKNVA